MKRKSPEQRFWERVVRGGADECWLWTGPRISGKWHGQVSFRGRHMGAHRVAWELLRGPIPEGAWMCHTCDNPVCVNPAHLYIGTARSNILDAYTRGGRRKLLRVPRKCAVEHCTRENAIRDWCKPHYMRQQLKDLRTRRVVALLAARSMFLGAHAGNPPT